MILWGSGDFLSPGDGGPGAGLGRQRVMPSASRNSSLSRAFDDDDGDDDASRGVQSLVRGDSSPEKERTERTPAREREWEVGRTSSEPRRVFRVGDEY